MSNSNLCYFPLCSTLHLFADFETPNHQSAFVCLVAHMKNLINIQSTKMLASSSKGIGGGGSGLDLHKAKSTRIARSKEAAGHTTAIRSNQRKNIDIPITEIFVRPKKFKSPAPQTLPPASKKSDLASGNRTAGNVMQTPEVSKKMSNTIELSGKVTKAKSRRKLTGAKSNMINLVQLVKSTSQLSPTIDTGHSAADSIHNEILSGRRTTRKRKIAADIATNKYMSITNIPATPTLRSSTRASKNARLSNDMPVAAANALNNKTLKYLEINASRVGQRTASFSPPLTRSRLKQLIGQDQMSKGFTTPIVDIKKRKG